MIEPSRYLTPPQYADVLVVADEKIIEFINSGELRAVNVATKGSKRPRWRITPEAIAEFEASRSNAPPPPKPKQRRQRRKAEPKGYVHYV